MPVQKKQVLRRERPFPKMTPSCRKNLNGRRFNHGKKVIHELKSLPVGYYIVAVIAAAGLSVAAYRLYAGLGVTTNLSKAFPWASGLVLICPR